MKFPGGKPGPMPLANFLDDLGQVTFQFAEILCVACGVRVFRGTVWIRFARQLFPCADLLFAVIRCGKQIDVQLVPLYVGEGDGAQTAAGFVAALFVCYVKTSKFV
jgi:hypothetical protein